MRGAKAAVITAVGLLVFSSMAFAGPAVATRYSEPQRWKNPKLTQEQCLSRAETVLVAMKFENIERTDQSRYGTAGEYTGSIRCIIDKQIVFFTVSGPERQSSNAGSGVMFQRFEAAD